MSFWDFKTPQKIKTFKNWVMTDICLGVFKASGDDEFTAVEVLH